MFRIFIYNLLCRNNKFQEKDFTKLHKPENAFEYRYVDNVQYCIYNFQTFVSQGQILAQKNTHPKPVPLTSMLIPILTLKQLPCNIVGINLKDLK